VRSILHVDMDAFYASVEQRDDPRLRGRPVVVGGPSKRGVVCAASYEARPFGVRSAMPMGEALRRCPHAIVVPPRMSRYVEVSVKVFAVFHRYTPLVEGLSLDEAFLDVTGSRGLFGDAETIARKIKGEILVDTGLTASAGVASIKFAAKIASDLDKPNGLVVVPEDVAAFLAPLPIERMWGLGVKAAPRVRDAGYATFADLAGASLDALEGVLGKSGALHVHLLARGLDDRAVVPGRAAISVGAEETFEHDLTSRADLEVQLLALAARVAQRLLRADLSTRGVTLKVKYADFSLKTRALKLADAVADTDSLYDAARQLLERAPKGRVRLLGISANDLVAGFPLPEPSLFSENKAPERRHRLEAVVGAVHERFGAAGLTRAALLDRGPSVSRSGYVDPRRKS
jgi:DNA polymerase IV